MLARWLLALGVVCLLVAPAAAQNKPDYDAAKRHYMAGREAQSKGDYEGAVRSFILAYDITKDPSLFKQIATAYEASGKKLEALVYYRRYLTEAKAGPDVEEVKKKVKELEAASAPPPQPPAPQPPAPQPPGPQPPATQPSATPTPAPAPTAAPPPELEPAKLPPEQPPTASPAVEPLPPVPDAPVMVEDAGAGWQRTAGWISVGLAAVAVTTGAVLATSSASREEDINRLVDFREPVTRLPSRYTGAIRDDYESKDDEGRKLGRLAMYSFIGAGVLTGAAVVFFVLDATRDVETAPPVSFSPAIGPGTLGASVSWEL